MAQLLALLGNSKYTVSSTKEFISKLRSINPPDGYQMISFDVVSLFTNVPLEKTIDIIIKKVYKEKRIKTKIKADKLRALLYLCTKEGHFTFNDEIYVQVDGVMMGSPLGSLIANIFMCELENDMIPKMTEKLDSWTRYVDDTFAFVKPTEIDNIHRQLNGYHPQQGGGKQLVPDTMMFGRWWVPSRKCQNHLVYYVLTAWLGVVPFEKF